MKMFLHSLEGLTIAEVLDLFHIQHDVLIGFTRDGEVISLASEWPEGQREERVFFVVCDVDTECVTEFWEFPNNYHGIHPVMFME